MKIKKILPQTIKSEVSFIDEIKNFDIVTEKMNDNFYTYRLGSNVMMWLNDEGVIGEIECIFPAQTDNLITLWEEKNTVVQNGFPMIDTDIIENEAFIPKVRVFNHGDYFILYFSNMYKYNKEIISENLTFYVKDTELIAIKAELTWCWKISIQVSLAYYYHHLYEGWYDESPWVIPDNKKALEQFETIDIKLLDNVTQKIMMKLIKLLKDNLDGEIFIEYS